VTCALTYDRVVSWDTEPTALTTRVADPLFTRPEPRQAFTDLVRALLADVPRKNSWQLAGVPEHVAFRTKPQLVIDMLAEEDAVPERRRVERRPRTRLLRLSPHRHLRPTRPAPPAR
jgi:hypothetical protein